MNQRKKALIIFAITVGFLTFVTVFGIVVTDGARVTDFSKKNMAPLSFLSLWNGLVRKRYAASNVCRTFYEYPHRTVSSRF